MKPFNQVVKVMDFDSMMRRFKSGKGCFGVTMIEATLLVEMMAKYIQENGIKELMKLVMKAIEATKED